MKASDRCFEIIKFFEDFRSHLYVCPGGIRTIGYGHAIMSGERFSMPNGDRFSIPIRLFEAEGLLFDDVSKKEKTIDSLLASTVVLRQYQWDALVSFAFNVKETLFRRSTLMRLINEGKPLEAAQQFGRWIYAGFPKTVQPGLVLRREIESRLFAGAMETVLTADLPDYIEEVREVLREKGRLV